MPVVVKVNEKRFVPGLCKGFRGKTELWTRLKAREETEISDELYEMYKDHFEVVKKSPKAPKRSGGEKPSKEE